eukprot:gene16647-18337_t
MLAACACKNQGCSKVETFLTLAISRLNGRRAIFSQRLLSFSSALGSRPSSNNVKWPGCYSSSVLQTNGVCFRQPSSLCNAHYSNSPEQKLLRDASNFETGERRRENPICHSSSLPTYYYTFPLVVGIQTLLINMQSFTGLPWWATIVSSTILLRFVITLPLARVQATAVAKTELLQPTLKEVYEALKHNIAIKGKRNGESAEEVERKYRQEARKYTLDIYRRENCNPMKLYLLPWVQLPLWILISLALRNISGFFPKTTESVTEIVQCHPDLLTGGCLWFHDLTVSDPYYIIPVIIGVTNLLNIELNTLRRKVPSMRQRILTRVFRIMTVGMMLASSQVPTAMSLYWATSSSYGLAQNICLMQPSVRRKLGIPQAPSESKTPFKDKFEILKTKWQDFMIIQRKH